MPKLADLDAVTVARLRELWQVAEMSRRQIAEQLGLSLSQVIVLARRLCLPDRRTFRQKRAGTPAMEPAEAAGKLRIIRVERAWRLADAQIAAQEKRLRRMARDAPATEFERAARALAVLVGALKELESLDRAMAAPRAEASHAKDLTDDAVDALRARIAQRLAAGDGSGPAGSGGGDDRQMGAADPLAPLGDAGA